MTTEYIQVVDDEGDEIVELPLEDDNTLLLTTLQAQYPGASGLKYRYAETNATRGLRLVDGRLHPPPGENGWLNTTYTCVFPKENKRKRDDSLDMPTAKRIELKQRCTDLIVIGLPYKTTEDNLREYFEKFGELKMAQINTDKQTGKSRGFGFIRYTNYDGQLKAMSQRHFIDNRWCVVKIPNSREDGVQQPTKIFVGRCTEDITHEDLKEYFSKFGEVTDVYIPRPFRSFGFVTFADSEVAQSLCGEDHIIKNASLYVSNAAAKNQDRRNNINDNRFNDYGRNDFSGRNDYGNRMDFNDRNDYVASGGRNEYGGGRNDYSIRYDNDNSRFDNNRGSNRSGSNNTYQYQNRGGGVVDNQRSYQNVWDTSNINIMDTSNMSNMSNQQNKNVLGQLLSNPALVVAALQQMGGYISNGQNPNQMQPQQQFKGNDQIHMSRSSGGYSGDTMNQYRIQNNNGVDGKIEFRNENDF